MTPRRLPIDIIALAFGFLTGLGQVLLLRTLLETVEENEIVLGLFFGFWFLGIIPGAWLGGRWGLRGRVLEGTVAGLLLGQAVLLVALISLLRAAGAVWGFSIAEAQPLTRLGALTAGHLLPFGFFTGLVFPLLCRLHSETGTEGREAGIGSVYAWEAGGALIAGVVFTFLLAGRAGAVILSTGAALAVAVPAAWMIQRAGGRAAAWSVIAVAGALAVSPLPGRLETATLGWWWKSHAAGGEWLDRAETPRQSLVLSRSGEQYTLFSNGDPDLTFPDPYSGVPFAQSVLAQKPRPARILLIGGLGQGLAPQWLAAGAGSIDLVESDPGRIRFLLPFLPAEERAAVIDPRVRVHTTDGRLFVRRQKGAGYDLIVSLTPSPDTIAANRYYTREYFRDAAEALAGDGVFVFRLETAVNYFDSDMRAYLGSIVAALSESFPDFIATEGVTRDFHAARRRGVLSHNPNELRERWEALDLDVPGFSPALFLYLFEPSAVNAFQDVLDHLPKGNANADLRPITLLHRLRVWSRIAGGAGVLPRDVRPLPVLAAWTLALAGVVLLLGRGRRSRGVGMRASALAAIGTTGFAAIGVSVLLLLAYQSARGSLYREIGLLMALFMGGLALGAHVLRKPPADPRRWLLWAEGGFLGLLILVGGSAPLLMETAALPIGIALLMLAVGAVAGAEFALAGHLYRTVLHDAGRAGGMVDAADHAGACTGSLMVGMLLFPVLGWFGAVWVLLTLKAASYWILRRTP